MTKNVPKVLPKTPHFFANICQLGYFLSKNPYQASIVRDFGHHVRCKGSPLNEIDMQYASYYIFIVLIGFNEDFLGFLEF